MQTRAIPQGQKRISDVLTPKQSAIHALGIFFAFIVLSVVFISIVLILGNNHNEKSLLVPASFLGPVVAEIVLVVCYGFYLKSKKVDSPFRQLSIARSTRFSVPKGIAYGFLLFLGFHIVVIALSLLGFTVGNSDSANLANSATSFSLWLTMICMGIFSPIAEELFFRGLLLSLWSNTFSKNVYRVVRFLPIFFVSCFFAAVHFQGFSRTTDYVVLGLTFVLGILAGTKTQKTNSIAMGIAIHMTYNVLTVGVSVLYLLVTR